MDVSICLLPLYSRMTNDLHWQRCCGNIIKTMYINVLPCDFVMPPQILCAIIFSVPASLTTRELAHIVFLLSVSNLYLALDEIYHPLCAPIPRNVTLSRHTVHRGLQMTNGTLALVDALFQEAYICASVGGAIRNYKSRPEARISMLSSSLFIRHY